MECISEGSSLQGMTVQPHTLLDVSGAVPESVTSSVLDACHNRGFSGIQDAISDAIASGWGVSFPYNAFIYGTPCMRKCRAICLMECIWPVPTYCLYSPAKVPLSQYSTRRVQLVMAQAVEAYSAVPGPCTPMNAMMIFNGTLQAQQLLLELQAGILRDSSLKDKQRARICTALAEADKCLVDGSDEFLQLLHVASVAQLAIQET